MMSRTTTASGRAWAYCGALLGGAVSVAANVAHSFIPPAGSAGGWRPDPGAVVGAIVWPVFLFIAVELLARVAWPRQLRWTLLRFGGMLPIAAVAAFVSYRHLSGLLAHYGEEPIVFHLGPLAVDGLMVMATGALLATGHLATPPAAPAAAAVTVTPPAPTTPVDPVSLPVAGRADVPPAAAPVPSRPTATPVPAPSAAPQQRVIPAVTAPASSTAPAARPAPSATDTPVTTADAASPRPPAPALLSRARHLAEAHHAATGTPITAGELAVRLRIDSATAARLLANLDTAPAIRPAVNGVPVGVSR